MVIDIDCRSVNDSKFAGDNTENALYGPIGIFCDICHIGLNSMLHCLSQPIQPIRSRLQTDENIILCLFNNVR